MIYDLQCPLGHKFEGWFPSPEAYEKQREGSLLTCSVCGIQDVAKVPSVIHTTASQVHTSRLETVREGASPKPPVLKKGSQNPHPTIMNVDPVVVLKAVQQYVKTNFKDVGNQFTEVATRMTKGETPHENVYGTATPDQCDRLETEGVPFFLFPTLPEEFEN